VGLPVPLDVEQPVLVRIEAAEAALQGLRPVQFRRRVGRGLYRDFEVLERPGGDLEHGPHEDRVAARGPAAQPALAHRGVGNLAVRLPAAQILVAVEPPLNESLLLLSRGGRHATPARRQHSDQGNQHHLSQIRHGFTSS